MRIFLSPLPYVYPQRLDEDYYENQCITYHKNNASNEKIRHNFSQCRILSE